jgi:hypothetical protein
VLADEVHELPDRSIIEMLERGPKTGPTLKSALRTAETPRGLSKNQLSDAKAKAHKYLREHESGKIVVEKYPGGGAVFTYYIAANHNDSLQSLCTSVSRALGLIVNAGKDVQMSINEQSDSMTQEQKELYAGIAATLHVMEGSSRELVGDVKSILPERVQLAEDTASRPPAESLGLLRDNAAEAINSSVASRIQRLSAEAMQLFGQAKGDA